MSAIAQKERLVSGVIRLRRAERAEGVSPARDDIAAVRVDLERMAGPTVTRAMAARLLGVSQTALDRWIATGDVPTLITRAGRREAPLHALIELTEAVREHRLVNPHDRHPLGSVLQARRSEAERLSTTTLLTEAERRRRDRDGGHRDAELRSLAYHRAVAQHLDERIVRDAQDRLTRWRSQVRIDPRYAQQWQKILAKPPSQIARLISTDTPRMRNLRQSSPFAGALSEPERRRALAAVDETPA
jgi:hypothetical protein